jgi:catechol 2,3-dioxygenase-like lactoylglutathione lyase family enzyme
MSLNTAGIHHVTAIASDPQRNLDFYAGVLGLRLVKRTVNFDDPTTYHFYFGDTEGSPGSIFTFFPWPHARRGRQGAGQIAVASFAILPSSVGFWIERFIKYHVEFNQPVSRFDDERVIGFKDPDGLMLELVAHASAESRPKWSASEIPADHSESAPPHPDLQKDDNSTWDKDAAGEMSSPTFAAPLKPAPENAAMPSKPAIRDLDVNIACLRIIT